MSNVIDFKSRKPVPHNAPAAPDPDRHPVYIVEFFDDPAFPMRFKGIEPSADHCRDGARRCMDAAYGLLAIGYNKDPDPSQLLRYNAMVMHDGQVFIDTFEPPGYDSGEPQQREFDWYIATTPAIADTLKRMKSEL